MKPKRINIIGNSASGKSTLGRRISEKLSIPYLEMDQIFWGSNWFEPSDEEFFPKLEQALSNHSWVLDGNFTRTIPIKWRNVDTVIWVDMPFLLNLSQSVKRATIRAYTKKEIWPGTGNRESFRKSFFSKSSVIWWMIKNHKKNRKRVQSYMIDPKFSHIRFIRISSRREMEKFLATLY